MALFADSRFLSRALFGDLLRVIKTVVESPPIGCALIAPLLCEKPDPDYDHTGGIVDASGVLQKNHLGHDFLVHLGGFWASQRDL